MKTQEEHPWVVVRRVLGTAGWHNQQQTFATEAEARAAHETPLSTHEAVSQLMQWVRQEDGADFTWKLEMIHVRRE